MTAISQTIENNLTQLYLLGAEKKVTQPLSIFENYIENLIRYDTLDTSTKNRKAVTSFIQKEKKKEHYYVR